MRSTRQRASIGTGSPIKCLDVIRVLHVALNAIENQIIRRERSVRSHPNAGKPWLLEDDQALARDFDAGKWVVESRKLSNGQRVPSRVHLVKSGKYPTVTRPTRLISKAVSRKLLIDSAIGAGETFWARRASSLDAGILNL